MKGKFFPDKQIKKSYVVKLWIFQRMFKSSMKTDDGLMVIIFFLFRNYLFNPFITCKEDWHVILGQEQSCLREF